MGQDTQKKTGKSLKKTLNLPKTSFPMKANLVQNEPATLKRWQKEGLYQQIRDSRAGSERFVFHDGPPYANGSIHLGHLLNKVMKDLVVRTRTMMGFDCPYIPGWDCHGLPIEHKVMQELGDKAKGMVPAQIRKRCQDYAQKFVKLQSGQMQRLLTAADYDNPYLTMNPKYEAAVLEVFARLVEQGVVYRDLKPVHWSIENQTALAEAELEYYDREDTSVYVMFDLQDAARLPATMNLPAGETAAMMIWTTTPWTLPANLAVAVGPFIAYSLYRFTHFGVTRYAVLADDLAEKVLNIDDADDIQQLGSCTGKELVDAKLTYAHPFIADDRNRPVVAADYVTLEDGTGLVHTAPGHGVEDYQTSLREGLQIYCPVLEDGTMNDTAPEFLQGKTVWASNDLVVEKLRATGHLFHDHKFNHSYPHDWRGKTPVIFRATEQWFVNVNQPLKEGGQSVQKMALAATATDVKFVPEWGRNRMRGMLETRPDWCLSRQRAWGLPIPAFFGPERGQCLLTAATVRAVADVMRAKGSDCWFAAEPAELLAGYDWQNDADKPDWLTADTLAKLTKAHDIFDVWFESGSSWNAVMRQRDLGFPIDLYLEGSDQHRGWFQLSLLPALGAMGQAPFKTVLTHGFMVDKDGKKMSKSDGNALNVDDLLKDLGADVCRWWVSSLNTDNDIKVDQSYFNVAGEEYRKVRNTIRFLLSNLDGFDIAKDARPLTADDASSIDAWAMSELDKLTTFVRSAYDAFSFRRANEAIFNFCNDTLSAVYLAAVKDRLYCDKPDSDRRRRTQTVVHAIADALLRLLAPILPHTADEGWRSLHGDSATSVHIATLPQPAAAPVHPQWPTVMTQRDVWLKAIESKRQADDIDNPMDLGVTAPAGDIALGDFNTTDLADLLGVSRFAAGNALTIDDLRDQPRCDRSWKRDGSVKPYTDEDGDAVMLSTRDAEAVGLA